MAYDDLLVNTIKAWKRDGTVDRLGQPTEADEGTSPFYVGPCRLANKGGGKINSDRFNEAFENYWTVFVQAGADIREDDEIAVYDASATNLILVGLVQRRYDIQAGTSAVHHVELSVYEQTGPQAGPGQAS